MKTTVYSALPRKLRRMKNAPPLRRKPADDRQIQIDAGGDVRHRIAALINRVRQQQVVHVAAMARHIDDLVALGDLLQRLDVLELDAVVQPVPQPRQPQRHQRDEGVRIVGGDLVGVTARLEQQRRGATGGPCRAPPAPRRRAPRACAAPRPRWCDGATDPARCARCAGAQAARAAAATRGAPFNAVSASCSSSGAAISARPAAPWYCGR